MLKSHIGKRRTIENGKAAEAAL